MKDQLTTLPNVKAWLGNQTTTSDDALLKMLIGQVSRFILSYTSRPTFSKNIYTDRYDGVGGCEQMLRNWPVLSVQSVTAGNQAIPAASDAVSPGYSLDSWDGFPPGQPQSVTLNGYRFCRGSNNVSIVYTAGFAILSEPQTVPAGATLNVNAPYGNWAVDEGVTYANGTPLTKVASNPAAGQYAVSTAQDSTFGTYSFASADINASLLISYSYVPADIEQACIELVAERYKYKNRVGEVSKSLGGQETMAYSQKGVPDYVQGLLSPYRRVVLL